MGLPNPNTLKTAKLVLAAIGDLQDSKGLTLDTITKHIENEFAVPNSEFSKHLTKAIDKGVAFGAIKRLKGRYFLGEVMDKIRSHRRRGRRGGSRRRRKSRSTGGRRRRRRRRQEPTI